jgi:hypothetical protein
MDADLDESDDEIVEVPSFDVDLQEILDSKPVEIFLNTQILSSILDNQHIHQLLEFNCLGAMMFESVVPGDSVKISDLLQQVIQSGWAKF